MNAKIREALEILYGKCPFFALQFGRLKVEEMPIEACMQVNTKRLWYNKDLVDKMPIGDVVFFLGHEIMHVVGKHAIRMVSIPEFNHDMFNVAADLAINSMLVDTLTAPTGEYQPIYPWGSNWQMEPNRDAEWYYAELQRRERQQKQEQEQKKQEKDNEEEQEGNEGDEDDGDSGSDDERDGDDGDEGEDEKGEGEEDQGEGDAEGDVEDGPDGSGSGKGDGKNGNGGKGHGGDDDGDGADSSDDDRSSGDEAEGEETEVGRAIREAMSGNGKDLVPHDEDEDGDATQVEQEVDLATSVDFQQSESIHAGSVGGKLKTVLNLELTPRPIPWQRALRLFVNAREWRKYRYSRPNRRQHREDIILPNRGNKTVGNICLVADTSGSMSTALPKIVTELSAMVLSYPSSVVTLIQVDTEVRGITKIGKGMPPIDWSKFEWKGLGGTEITPGVEAAMKLSPTPSFIIIATDYYLGSIPPNPKVPVIWLLTSDYGNPPYGNVIRMNNQEK